MTWNREDHTVEKSEYPIVVIASSKAAGARYADQLGISNYFVADTKQQTQGRRFRGIIITPQFLIEGFSEFLAPFDSAMQSLSQCVVDAELG